MSYSKLSTILLYVVAGISLVVMLFFYAAPTTLNADELDARFEALTSQDVMLQQAVGQLSATDSSATDSLSAVEAESSMVTEPDSAAMEATTEPEMAATAEVTPGEIDLRDHFTGWEIMVHKRTDYALGWAYILFIIAALAALAFPMVSIATNMKAIIRLAAILGATAVLILLSYFVLADSTPVEILGYTGTDNSDPGVLKWVGTGLFITYFLFGLAVLSILYSEVVKLFK